MAAATPSEWDFVQQIRRVVAGCWVIRCGNCDRQFQGGANRVRAHFGALTGQGVARCPKLSDPVAATQFVCDCVFRRRRGCPCDLQEPEKAKKAFLQFTDFMLGTAPFDAATIAEAKDMPAHKWWALYGATVPELQRVAMIVLAAVSGAGEAERCWKAVDWIHCKRRNRLTAPRAKKLLRVYTSQQLAAKTLASAGEEQYWAWHKSDSEGGEDEEEQEEEEEASPPP